MTIYKTNITIIYTTNITDSVW